MGKKQARYTFTDGSQSEGWREVYPDGTVVNIMYDPPESYDPSDPNSMEGTSIEVMHNGQWSPLDTKN